MACPRYRQRLIVRPASPAWPRSSCRPTPTSTACAASWPTTCTTSATSAPAGRAPAALHGGLRPGCRSGVGRGRSARPHAGERLRARCGRPDGTAGGVAADARHAQGAVSSASNCFVPRGRRRRKPRPNAMFISVIVPVRNEARFIGDTLRSVARPGLPAPSASRSSSPTAARPTPPPRSCGGCWRRPTPTCRSLDNPRRLVDAGRNVAVRAARGDIVVVVDGHCQLDNPTLPRRPGRRVRPQRGRLRRPAAAARRPRRAPARSGPCAARVVAGWATTPTRTSTRRRGHSCRRRASPSPTAARSSTGSGCSTSVRRLRGRGVQPPPRPGRAALLHAARQGALPPARQPRRPVPPDGPLRPGPGARCSASTPTRFPLRLLVPGGLPRRRCWSGWSSRPSPWLARSAAGAPGRLCWAPCSRACESRRAVRDPRLRRGCRCSWPSMAAPGLGRLLGRSPAPPRVPGRREVLPLDAAASELTMRIASPIIPRRRECRSPAHGERRAGPRPATAR